jgi:hypothetical protein
MVALTRTRIMASVALAALAGALLAGSAAGSQLIDRNPGGVKLAVNAKGEALITYRARGRVWHVLAWGAVDARQPASYPLPQVRFKKDYAGGWGKYRTLYWRRFRNACRPYDGPSIPFVVAACRAPDGSFWALQAWRTELPDLGFAPWLPIQRANELHLSHWSGPMAKLEVWTDWIYGGRFHDLFGRLTYQGRPVHGFKTDRYGAPLDSYGRLVYLDTFNSRYGRGWRRENSFVAHKPTGVFCHGFYPFNPQSYPHPPGWPKGKLRGPANGSKYRLAVEGPGVSPDVSVVVPGLHDFNPNNPADLAYERQQNAVLDSIVGVDRLCRQH